MCVCDRRICTHATNICACATVCMCVHVPAAFGFLFLPDDLLHGEEMVIVKTEHLSRVSYPYINNLCC